MVTLAIAMRSTIAPSSDEIEMPPGWASMPGGRPNVQLESEMSMTLPGPVSLPSLKHVNGVRSVQFVMAMWEQSIGFPIAGLAFKQMESSALLMEQLDILPNQHPSKSMPSANA